MTGDPTPLVWYNLLRWVRDTRRIDDRRYGPPPPRPTHPRVRPNLGRALFVVGAPRSGTSFLGDVCGALPEFSYHYEPAMTKAASRYVYEGQWSFRKARWFFRATYAWLLRRHGASHLRFAEKTPQNSFIIDFLARAFPDASFLHIVRDGRDAALSYSRLEWLQARSAGSGRRESGGYPIGPYPRYWIEPERRAEFRTTSDLHRCIWAWRRHTEAALEGLSRLPSDRVCEVRFEKLVAPEAMEVEATRILEFLGIEDPNSQNAMRSGLSKARPDRVGDWKRELGEVDLAMIDAEAGAVLTQLGYR